MGKRILPLEIILSKLDYDPQTGFFTWKKTTRRFKAGTRANAISDCGYHVINLDGKRYQSHRLAWQIIYKTIPEHEIDHINGNKLDNRICNLRLATRAENQRNVKLRKDNTSGYKGVCLDKSKNKWKAQASIAGVLKHLGLFETPELAATAYKNFTKLNHGEFYREI
jgi:hypothetical protein